MLNVFSHVLFLAMDQRSLDKVDQLLLQKNIQVNPLHYQKLVSDFLCVFLLLSVLCRR